MSRTWAIAKERSSSFRRARELLAPAAHAPGAPTPIVGNFVDAIRFESEILGVIGSRTDEALAAARAAVTEASAAAASRPDDDDAQALVAAAEFAFAIAVGKPDSLPHWTRAGAVYETLLARRPNDASRQRNAALVEKYLGNFLEEIGSGGGAGATIFVHSRWTRHDTTRRPAIAPLNSISRSISARWRRCSGGRAARQRRRPISNAA